MAHEWLQRLAPADQALARVVVKRGLLTPDALAALVAQAPGVDLAALLRPRLAPEQLAVLVAAASRSSSGSHDVRTFLQPPPGGSSPGDVTVLGAPPGARPAAPGPAGLAPGARVGPYVVEKELARGGMGVVLVARHQTLGRRVALKVLQGAARPEVQERLRIEAAAAARLKHPNIVSVLEVGEQDGAPWLAMDLVEGEDLARRVERDGPLDPQEAARVLETVARAMGYAHQQAILHRDLKPHNVLVDRAGVPFVVDFGLAKDVDRDTKGITVTGTFLGTPAYMPPEQAGGDLETIDRRSDVYSLGATLYHLLVGRPPFEGATVVNVVAKVLGQEPVRPRALRPELDADLETVCLRCLEKDPAARYPTAGALADDLARWRAGDPILARPVGPLARLARRVRRNRALSAGLAVVGVALVVVPSVSAALLYRAQDEANERRLAAEAAERAASDAEHKATTAEAATRLERERALAEAALERAYAALGAARFVDAVEAFDAAGVHAAAGSTEPFARAARRGAAEGRTRLTPAATLDAPGGGTTRVAVGGGRVAVAGADGLRLWRTDALGGQATLLPVGAIALNPECRAVALSPDGARGAVSWAAGRNPALVVVWDLAAGRELWRRSEGAGSGPDLLAFSGDALVVAAGDTRTALVLDAATGRVRERVARTERGAPAEPDPSVAAPLPGGAFLLGWADGVLTNFPAGGFANLGRKPIRLAAQLLDEQPLLLVGDADGGVELRLGPRPVLLARGERGRVVGLSALRDGGTARLAAAFGDGSVAVWGLDGALLGSLRVGTAGSITDCALLDHERVVVGREGRAEVWPYLPRRAIAGEGPVAFSRAGRRVLAVASTRTDDPDRALAQHSRRVRCLDLSGAAPRSLGAAIELDLFSRAPLSPVDVLGVAFAAADRELVLLLRDRIGRAFLLERRAVDSGELLARSPRVEAYEGRLAVAGGRALVGSALYERSDLQVWALDALDAPTRSLRAWHSGLVQGLAWLPDEGFASVAADGVLARWGPSGDRPDAAVAVARGVSLAPGASPGGLELRERDSMSLACVASSPDGRALAVGSDDGILRVLPTSDLTARPAILRGHRTAVAACAFLPDGRLVSAARDGTLVVWDLDAARPLRTVEGSPGLTGLAVSADGALVATCAPDGCSVVDVSVGE